MTDTGSRPSGATDWRSEGSRDDPRPSSIPTLPHVYLHRARLWDRLTAAAEGAVTLVVAPAGAGKTLGVAGWLGRTGRAARTRWVESDPGLGVHEVRRLVQGRDSGSRSGLLVLDDAHRLAPDVLGLLDDLLSHDPHRLRLVLVSRRALPFTVLKPELRGELTILHGDLLRLDPDEEATLVAHHARTDSAGVLEAIHDRARGWCGAVVLAARAVAASADAETAMHVVAPGAADLEQIGAEAFRDLTDRQRHLLLCTASEPVVSRQLAGSLSGDADAGRSLEELASTGLVVSRHADDYELHPLIAAEARRVLMAGGADAGRARASIRDAVTVGLRHGAQHRALARLLSSGAADAAVQVLADDGIRLVLAGEADEVGLLLRDHSQAVDAVPRSWLPVAGYLWLAGDAPAAMSWLNRMELQEGASRRSRFPGETEATGVVRHLCADLMRAGISLLPLERAMADGEAALRRPVRAAGAAAPLRSLAHLLLGVSQLRLGRFAEADETLARALLDGRSQQLKALSAWAGSALAMCQLVQGREHVALELTDGATTRDRYLAYGDVDLVRSFALLQSRLPLPESVSSAVSASPPSTLHPADDIGAALSRVHHARLRLLQGLVADAERTLDNELLLGRVPEPVRVLVLVELALCAAVALDPARLTALHDQLERAGAPGEAAFVAALRADVAGDDRTAIGHCAQAVVHSTCLQPPVAAMARVVRSQLLDAAGRRAEAQVDLGTALVATEVRRNALPFWGWSRHGSTVISLLHGLPSSARTAWSEELRHGLADNPGGITSLTGPVVATAQERAHVAEGRITPPLSSRERGVLRELARGATYADIAATLHLSENTVKTHVSRVYTKLGVGRRSDALAVARTLGLL